MFAVVKMNNRIFILWFCLMIPFFYVNAQNWPKIYGDDIHATIRNLNETYDKGYFLTAYTYTTTGVPEFYWIIKIDINGNILWDKKFGDGSYSNGLTTSAIKNDNGLILAAGTTKYSGNYDPTFISMDVCGEIEWCRVLSSPDHNYATGIIQLADGSYVGMLQYYGQGESYARISLIKMDQAGEPIWIQQLAQEDTLIYNEEGYAFLETFDNNYLVSGRCFYPGLKPFWILTDTAGEQIWDLKWSNVMGSCFQTIEYQNGIFYGVGYSDPPGSQNIPTIYKFNALGNEISKFQLMGDTIYSGGGGGILKLNNSSLLTGLVWIDDAIPNPNEYSEVFETDTFGTLINRRLLLNEDQAPSILNLSSDNKILVTGSYVVDGNWDIYLWKMNYDLEDDTLYTQPITYDSLCPYQILSDTVDLDCSLFVNIDEIPTKEEYESTIKISPNPAGDWVMLTLPDNVSAGDIELAIYNIFGQEVLKTRVSPRNRTVSLNVSNLSSSLYLATCKDIKKRIFVGKFVVGR
jgi:hypothetical protein